MSNEYKQTLARFEKAVRAHAFIGTLIDHDEKRAVEKEYEEASHAIRVKLAYRQKG